MTAGWDADRYQRQFGFVSGMAGDLVELLGPRPGEVVLDLGCGTGELAAAIAATGARVLALDSDPAMVAAARRRLGDDRGLRADGHAFTLADPVDAVFSHAAFTATLSCFCRAARASCIAGRSDSRSDFASVLYFA